MMSKRDDIEDLKRRVTLLEQRVVELMATVARLKEPSLKSYKEIQQDWYARHGDMVKCPPDKGPVPFAHPRRGVPE